MRRPVLRAVRPLETMVLLLMVFGLLSLGGCPVPLVDSNPGTGQTGENPQQELPDGEDPGDNTDPGGENPGDNTDPGGTDPEPTDSTLAGQWTGDVAYQSATYFGSSPISEQPTVTTRPTQVTFDAQGLPDVTTIVLTEVPMFAVEVPLTGLRTPGQTKTIEVERDGEIETVTVKVDTVQSSATTYDLKLSVTYDMAGMLLAGPHDLSAAIQDNGSLLWSSETLLQWDGGTGIRIGTRTTASGNLTRQ